MGNVCVVDKDVYFVSFVYNLVYQVCYFLLLIDICYFIVCFFVGFVDCLCYCFVFGCIVFQDEDMSVCFCKYFCNCFFNIVVSIGDEGSFVIKFDFYNLWFSGVDGLIVLLKRVFVVVV